MASTSLQENIEFWNQLIEYADVMQKQTTGAEDVTWTAPNGETGKSFLGYVREFFEVFGHLPRFKTVEALKKNDADFAAGIEGAIELKDGSFALVADDVADKNGIYIKEGGNWHKSKYDFLSLLDKKMRAIAFHSDDSDLLTIKDSDSLSVASISSDGSVHLAGLSSSVQDEIRASKPIHTDSSDLLLFEDSSANSVMRVDSKGNLYIFGFDKPLQKMLGVADVNSRIYADIKGENKVGKILYADLPQNKKSSHYYWEVDGELVSNYKSYIEVTPSLQGRNVSAYVLDTSAGDIATDGNEGSIGGVALESQGETGTIYEGFVLSDGDDFNELDIIAPHKPLGRWFTTRTYLEGARGSDTLLGTMYNTDPYHTGYMDSNRGVPVGYDAMQLKNGYVRLGSRVATNDEKKHFQGDRNEVASLLTSVGAFSFYAGDEGTGDTILEFKVRHSLAERNPHGWHPSLWTQSSLPSVTFDSDEWDISEGTHDRSLTNYNRWGGAGSKGYGETMRIMDNEWHLVTAIFNHTRVKVYLDNVLVKEIEQDANTFNEPAYALVTNHIFNGNYAGSIYSKEMWDMFTQGTYIDVDFVRIWRKQGTQHIKPLVQIPPVNVDYGSTATITLPPKTGLWGDISVLEHVQIVMTEENEPGGHHTQAYNSLPSFANYNIDTRTLTVDTTNQKSGRLNVVVYGYKQDGSSCSPARTYINVAPRITVDTIEIDRGSSYDLYVVCDCGVLVTDGVKRTKKIEALSLPAGVVYNDETGLISVSNSSAVGDTQITVQCVNSVNQVTTKQVTLKVK